METTRLSSKGQIVLPKAIRDAYGWREGLELIVEDIPDWGASAHEQAFSLSTLEQVAGSLRYSGRAKTIEEMDAGITEEVRRRRARGRY